MNIPGNVNTICPICGKHCGVTMYWVEIGRGVKKKRQYFHIECFNKLRPKHKKVEEERPW